MTRMMLQSDVEMMSMWCFVNVMCVNDVNVMCINDVNVICINDVKLKHFTETGRNVDAGDACLERMDTSPLCLSLNPSSRLPPARCLRQPLLSHHHPLPSTSVHAHVLVWLPLLVVLDLLLCPCLTLVSVSSSVSVSLCQSVHYLYLCLSP